MPTCRHTCSSMRTARHESEGIADLPSRVAAEAVRAMMEEGRKAMKATLDTTEVPGNPRESEITVISLALELRLMGSTQGLPWMG